MKIQIKTLLFVAAIAFLGVACSDKPKTSDDAVAVVSRPTGHFLDRETALARKRAIRQPAYQIDIDLGQGDEHFAGSVTATFIYAGDGSALTVDFRYGRVLSVLLNGSETPFEYNDEFITLPAGAFESGPQTLVINYEHRYSPDGAGLYRYEDQEDGRIYLYTDFEPYDANRLFPHFDQPDLKATYELSVRAPTAWQVVSTTRETAMEDEGDVRLWRFPPTEPISSYIFSLHAGDYQVIEGPEFRYPLRLFVRHSLAQYVDADYWFAKTIEGFDFFDEYFELPYPFAKYDQLIVPDYISGAMENVAAVTFNETFLQRRASTRSERFSLTSVIMHEMAHMWFGDITTMGWWNGLWLNESFATYMGSLAMEGATEFDEVWHRFFTRSKQSAYFADQLVTTHPIELPVRNTTEATSNFDSITYGKGASVLKQLDFLLGGDVFRQGVRDYLAANAWSNTELEDFIGAMANAADRNLDDWTQRWLYQAGVNSISVDLGCEQGVVESLALVQTAPEDLPILREQRVRLGLYDLQNEVLTKQHSVDVMIEGERTEVALPEGLACPALAYPNQDDFGYMKIVLDPRSVDTLANYIMTLEDSLLRIMVWDDLYKMAQNAELPLTRYLDILERNLPQETDLVAMRDLTFALRGSFGFLHQIENGDALLADYAGRFEPLLWRLVSQSDGDARQTWLNTYIDTANNEFAWQRLQQLLSGELILADYELDQDTRWRIVLKLNEFRRPNHAALALAEAEKDGSAIGQENAVRAKVLAARGDDKMMWFDKAMAADEDFSLRRSRTILRGLFPYSSQRSLAAPYAQRMVDAMPAISAAQNSTFHDKATQYQMPRLCSVENAQRLKAAAKQYPDLDPAIIKGMKRSAQLDERCAAISELLQSEAKAAAAAL